jgi:hypothetical protein
LFSLNGTNGCGLLKNLKSIFFSLDKIKKDSIINNLIIASRFVSFMHDTHLIKSIFRYLDKEEKSGARRITKIYISLSEFGGINEKHFIEQYRKESQGTKWESLKIQIKKVPYGPELKIVRLDFE